MTIEQLKELIEEYINANDWYSILELMTYENCIEWEVITLGNNPPTYPDFFNNNSKPFYFHEFLKLRCEIERMMLSGVNAVLSLFLVKNSMLRGYGIEWEGIANNLKPKFNAKSGNVGKDLEIEVYEAMSSFHKVVIPLCITSSSGTAIGDPSSKIVIGDPSSGSVLIGL